MKKFIFDTLLDKENILNQTNVINELKDRVSKEGRIVLHGMRNTAKTSIIKNVIIPFWQKSQKQSLAIYCDLMGVKDIDDISERLTLAFNSAYSKLFVLKSALKDGIKFLSGLRPTFQLASDGNGGEFSLKTESNENIVPFDKIFKNLDIFQKEGISVLICLDEFQDIVLVKTAEAKLRKSLQELSPSIPIIISGSKQHLLSDIFEKPRAPFYQWGYRLAMEKIKYQEYNNYIRERFNDSLKNTSDEDLVYLQDLLMRAPEPINRICYEANLKNLKSLDKTAIDDLINDFIENNQSSFEARLSYFSHTEIKFLKLVANSKTIANPHSKEVLRKVDISSPGMIKLLKRLQNDGVITYSNSKYFITDPFMMHFLIRKRLN